VKNDFLTSFWVLINEYDRFTGCIFLE